MSEAKITKEIGIIELVQKYPKTAAVLRQFGMGCLGCVAARFENLEQGAGAHGIDVDALVDAINESLT